MKAFEKWWEENGGGVCGKEGCERAWDAALKSIDAPPESRYDEGCGIKPLSQYLDEYIEREVELGNIRPAVSDLFAYDSWRELLEQALDAYQSTENVTIRIERNE